MASQPAAAKTIDDKVGRYGLVTLLVGLVQLVVTTDFSVISVALPSIGAGLHIGPAALSWVVSGAAIPFAGFLILAGRISDLYGPRWCMLGGLALFAAGSLASAFAPSFESLVAARALQGIGGAILTPANFSLINTLVPEGAHRNRALGVFTLMQGLAMVIGLLVGGVLTTTFGWRSIFLITPPIILLAGVLAARLVPANLRAEVADRSVDLPGAILITAGSALLLFAVSAFGRVGPAPQSWAYLGASAAAFVALWFVESRAAAPLIPLSVFGRRNFTAGALIGGCLTALVGIMLVLPNIYMQSALKFDAMRSGFGIAPYGMTVIIFGNIAPLFMKRFPHRWVTNGGYAVAVVGALLLAAFSHAGYYGLALAPWLIFTAMGATIGFTGMMSVSTADLPADQQGVGSAVLFTVQQISLPIGVATALAIVAAGGGADFRGGYLTAAVIMAAGVAIGLIGLRGAPMPEEPL